MTIDGRPSLRLSRTLTAHLGDEAGTSLHVTLGRDAAGAPLEVFLDLDYREGSPVREMLCALARGASRALQRGEPLSEILDDWRYVRGQDVAVAGVEGVTSAPSLPALAAELLALLAGAP